jgi:hypothetical protein
VESDRVAVALDDGALEVVRAGRRRVPVGCSKANNAGFYLDEILGGFESGYCAVVNPPDVIKEFGPDGQPVYAGLSFLVCPPRGQPAAQPMEDVELIPEE